MKKSPNYIFLALAIIITIMALLYSFRIISAWKLAVLTVASAVYSIIAVIQEQRLLRERTKNMKELLVLQQKLLSNEIAITDIETREEFIEAIAKVKNQETETSSFWSLLIPYVPLAFLILGLSIDIELLNERGVNVISAFGVAISSLSVFQQKEIAKQIPALENDLLQISDRIIRAQNEKEQEV